MADFEKRIDPNATIQLDQIDAMDLARLEEDAIAKAESRPPPATERRTAPPPLPPSAAAQQTASPPSTVAPPSSSATAAPRSAGKTIAYCVVFVVLLAGATFGGLAVGSRLRGEPASVAASASPAPTQSAVQAAPSVAAQPSSHPLTIPAVEISGP